MYGVTGPQCSSLGIHACMHIHVQDFGAIYLHLCNCLFDSMYN